MEIYTNLNSITMKELKKIKEVKELNKREQKEINGGIADRCRFISCVPEDVCINGVCVPRPKPWEI